MMMLSKKISKYRDHSTLLNLIQLETQWVGTWKETSNTPSDCYYPNTHFETVNTFLVMIICMKKYSFKNGSYYQRNFDINSYIKNAHI